MSIGETENNKHWLGCGEIRALCNADTNVNYVVTVENSIAVP